MQYIVKIVYICNAIFTGLMQNERITLFDKTFKPFIPYEKLIEAIDAVASKVNADFKDCQDIPIILCVLNGSVMFTAELMKRLDFNCQLASLKLSSYSGTKSQGTVRKVMGLTAPVEGRRVIVIEDIVDTGNTIVALKEILEENGASEVRICTMLLKPEVYSKEQKLDYVAMEIPNRFIVGFGLDYDELGRNLKDIYILDED